MMFFIINVSSFAQNAQHDSYQIVKNTTTVFNVRSNDNYEISDYFTVPYQDDNGISIIPPQHGVIVFLNYYTILYMPDSNYVGHDEFVYGIAYSDKVFDVIDTARVFVNIVENNTNTCFSDFIFLQDTGFNNFLFHDQSSQNIQSWYWDFGNGTTSTMQNPEISFADSGYFNVCLTVSTDFGCEETFCQNIYAPDYNDINNCSSYFYYLNNTSDTCFNCYSFYDLSSDNVASWFWDFGDGSTSGLQNPNHSFLQAGNYNTCLTITSALGCMQQYCTNIEIQETETCSADFSMENLNDSIINFSSLASENSQNWFWTFGDNISDTIQNPQHIFHSSGIYQVCLKISTSGGCENTICKEIQITQQNSVNIHFGGMVWAGEQLLPEGIVVLFDTVDHFKAIGWNYVINGVWSFDAAPGKYIVYAIPHYDYQLNLNKMYFPSYSGNTLHWKGASAIDNEDVAGNIDIHLQATDNLLNYYGSGAISGDIFYTSDSSYESEVFDDYWFNEITEGSKISHKANNIPILILNDQQIPVKFVLSKDFGKFNFTNLGFGSYTVHAEKAGMLTLPLNVTLKAEEPAKTNVSIYIESVYITSGISDLSINRNFQNIELFPIPVSDVLNIKTQSITFNDLIVEIFDITGKKILSDYIVIKKENNLLQINTENMQEGIYFVKFISESGFVFTSKIIK